MELTFNVYELQDGDDRYFECAISNQQDGMLGQTCSMALVHAAQPMATQQVVITQTGQQQILAMLIGLNDLHDYDGPLGILCRAFLFPWEKPAELDDGTTHLCYVYDEQGATQCVILPREAPPPQGTIRWQGPLCFDAAGNDEGLFFAALGKHDETRWDLIALLETIICHGFLAWAEQQDEVAADCVI